ncbi:MAG: hypothetical protein K8R23_16015 [Chthoniobacter sp.]|nr:hypothetical protein [Chthoniobacter sp.]
MPFEMSPLHNLLVLALVAISVIAVLATTILGWIGVSQIRRSGGRLHGMWLAVFDGLLFPVLLLVIFCFRLAAEQSARTNRGVARFEAAARSSHVTFSFTHPEQLGGNEISMSVQDGRVSNWLPSSGQALSLKDGKYLAVRVRVDATTPGSLIAEVMTTTSRDRKTWETKQAALGAGKRVTPLDFANGLHVSAWLGDQLARPSPAEAAISATPSAP